MKTTLLAISYFALCLVAHADEPSVPSPDGQHVLVLRAPKPDAVFPVIMLQDVHTSKEAEVFDYDSVGQGTDRLSALWSPDSRYVAFTIAVGPATQEVAVYHIADGTPSAVELLPIPKSLDAPRHGHRGGPAIDHWEGSRTLWVSDGQKYRVFRYRFTKQGKLRADRAKQLSPDKC